MGIGSPFDGPFGLRGPFFSGEAGVSVTDYDANGFTPNIVLAFDVSGGFFYAEGNTDFPTMTSFLRSTTGTYTPTAAGTLATAAIDVARFPNFIAGVNAGMLDEDGDINIHETTEDMTLWAQTSGVLSANSIGPTLSGVTFTADAGTVAPKIQESLTVGVSTNVEFNWQQAGTHEFTQFSRNALSAGVVNFDLNLGTTNIIEATGIVDHGMIPFGDGFICLVAYTATVGTQYPAWNMVESLSSARRASFTAAGTETVHFATPQYVNAQQVVSSYIPNPGTGGIARADDTLIIPKEVMAKAMADAAGSAEIWSGSPTVQTGWTDNLDGTFTCDGTQVGNTGLLEPTSATTNSHYITGFRVVSISAGNVKARVGGVNGAARTTVGTFPDVITAANVGNPEIRADVDFIGTVELISFREVTMPAAISEAMRLLLTYVDLGTVGQSTIYDRRVDVNNRITVTLDTDGAKTGTFTLTMVNGGVSATVSTAVEIIPGNNVTANLAWSMDGAGIGIALNGTDATQATAIGVPDLTTADVEYLTVNAVANNAVDREWFDQIESAGRIEASS